jgi:N-acetylglucosamine kinase-like BadF-type ATPase
MLDAVLKAADLSQSGDLIRYVHHDADKAKIAALAPLVSAAARKGDALALDILLTGAEELALLVKSVIRQSPWVKRRELVLAGGVIEHDEIITERLKEIITGEFPDLQVSLPKGSALEGACMLAANCNLPIGQNPVVGRVFDR